jgi:hypothetical protein
MTSNPNVRHAGTVTDLYGIPLPVGTDHSAVTFGPYTLDAAQQEEFAQLFVAACHQAKASAEAARAEAREEALDAALEATGRLDAAAPL